MATFLISLSSYALVNGSPPPTGTASSANNRYSVSPFPSSTNEYSECMNAVPGSLDFPVWLAAMVSRSTAVSMIRSIPLILSSAFFVPCAHVSDRSLSPHEIGLPVSALIALPDFGASAPATRTS